LVLAPVRRFLVILSHVVDASGVNDPKITLARLVDAGNMDARETGAAVVSTTQRISAAAVLAESNAAVLLITPSTALDPGLYRVTLRGSGGAALANVSAVTLGSDTAFEFTVEPAQ
jgi:hypothetical protein